MHYTSYRTSCKTCGKKILVEIVLCGISHNVSVGTVCGDCIALPLPDSFKEQSPQEAQEIEEWLADP